jgi:hypothetical protein
MDIPKVIEDALAEQLLPYSDGGLYVAMARAIGFDTPYLGSIKELSSRLGVDKMRFIEFLRRLRLIGAIEYTPGLSRYAPSRIVVIGCQNQPMNHPLPNATDEEPQVGTEKLDCFDAEFESCDEKGLTGLTGLKTLTAPVREIQFAPESQEYLLAARLLSRIKEGIDPKRRADLQMWASHIDRLHRLDGREYDEIAKVIDWMHTPSAGKEAHFWAGVILSTRKLRENFPTVLHKMGGWNTPRPSKAAGKRCPECEGSGVMIEVQDGEQVGVICPHCKNGRVPL